MIHETVETSASCVCAQWRCWLSWSLAKANVTSANDWVCRRDRVQQMTGWRIASVPGTLTSTLSSESVRRVNPARRVKPSSG